MLPAFSFEPFYCELRGAATKNPESLTLSGFLVKLCCYCVQGVWWGGGNRTLPPRPVNKGSGGWLHERYRQKYRHLRFL